MYKRQDDNYNIVGFNKVAEHMYPQIKKEEKCYRCLMNQEVPCAMCPIYNKIEVPKTYIDPVSGHYETVDAVDMDLPDGTHGHALIFGFAAEDGQKAVNEPLPANKEMCIRDSVWRMYSVRKASFKRMGY